jgi:hypothetical protein
MANMIARSFPKIISVSFEGVGCKIRADVSSKEPTKEQFDQLEFKALTAGYAEWVVKSIHKIDTVIKIEFWNGNMCTVFRPLYMIEKMEVSNG